MNRNWQDGDLDRRNKSMMVIMALMMPFGLLWLTIALLFKAPLIAAAASLVLLGFLGGWMLMHAGLTTLAKVTVLILGNLAVALAACAIAPIGGMQFVLLGIAGLPVIILSHGDERPFIFPLVALSVVLWLLLTVFAEHLAHWREIGPRAAQSDLAIICGLTLLALIVPPLSYFDRIGREYWRDLHQGYRDLKRAEAARTAFLKSMSHELRTPLSSIVGLAQLLELNDETRRDGQAIYFAGSAILSMVEKGILFSSLVSEPSKTKREEIDVRSLIETCVAEHEGLARARGVALATRIGAVGSVLGDREALGQALAEVVENAILYTTGRAEVVISAQTNGRSELQLNITNPAELPADQNTEVMFNAFERLGQANGVIPGLGVGLAIARQLVEGFGGKIAADGGHAGAPLCFRIHLPVATALNDA